VAVTYGGSLTLGQCVPTASAAQIALDASLGLAMPDFQARLTGALALSVSPPPDLSALIASAQALLAALQSLLAAPLPDASATAALVTELQATMATLTAHLALSASLGSLLSTAGIHFYAFAGRADAMGSEMASQLSGGLPGGAGGSESVAGVVMLANDGGAIAALESMFLQP
jgi:hypothetical protein